MAKPASQRVTRYGGGVDSGRLGPALHGQSDPSVAQTAFGDVAVTVDPSKQGSFGDARPFDPRPPRSQRARPVPRVSILDARLCPDPIDLPICTFGRICGSPIYSGTHSLRRGSAMRNALIAYPAFVIASSPSSRTLGRTSIRVATLSAKKVADVLYAETTVASSTSS